MVYLIHFEEPFKHSRHYIGFSQTPACLERRMGHHRSGHGASIMKAVTEAGIKWSVVRVWEDGDRNFERKLKNRKNSKKLCPICTQKELTSTVTLICSTECS